MAYNERCSETVAIGTEVQMPIVLLAVLIGTSVTLLSTFIGERSARAIYPDIMGCETGCDVVATGWPLIFVRDYLGMSVGNTADIMEVWFAADRFDWTPFLLNVAVWSGLFLTVRALWRSRMRREG